MLRVVLLSLFTLISSVAFAQMRQEIDQEALAKFKAKLAKERVEREARVQAYLEEHPSLQRITTQEDGTILVLSDIQYGKPLFLGVDNRAAAQTLGTDALSSTGEFGVDLQGEGMTMAVWDGGFNRPTHQEYDGRTRIGDSGDGFGVNFHASHVMGTILSSGVEERARGMAPKARGISFGFSNDLEEMTTFATTETDFIIMSNHSYGQRTGWSQGEWFGDTDVSEEEDWRFGYYSSNAETLDNLLYIAPYYTVVWSAGNDRNESGSPYPPDGPYDIISDRKTAKNNITVGAIEKISGGYTGVNSVVMSNFSSWGPVDDGRIKPDIVGAGVSIYSTFDQSDDDYASIGGTSMSAPNVSGSLLLIQELHKKLNAGRFMRSATLKSLLFHTANEAGPDGPDYVYGWGVMNALGMADLLTNANNTSQAIRELELNNGETYQLEFEPAPNTEVKATIVWTDLPGEPGPGQILDGDKLMLINDLDMRITDGNGTYSPWILNPANPGGGATTGDNFRDNSEQVVFTSTDGSPVTLTIGHKGELETGKQAYSLVLTYTPKTTSNSYHWVGTNGGDWNDASNWSLSTGGAAANAVPGINDVAIFDDNSFTNNQAVSVSFSQDQTIGAIKWLAPEEANVALAGFKLAIASDFVITSNAAIQSGTIELLSSASPFNKFVAAGVDLSAVDVVVNSPTTDWSFIGNLNLKSISLTAGNVDMSGATLTAEDIIKTSSSEASLNVQNAVLNISDDLTITGAVTYSDEGTTYNLTGTEGNFTFGGATIQGSINVSGTVNFDGASNVLDQVTVADGGDMHINLQHSIGDLTLDPGATLSFEPNVGIEITDTFLATGTNEQKINLRGSLEQSGFIQIDGHKKVCLDFLVISDVDVAGTASVTAGANSTTSNNSWPLVSCENVLFSDFAVAYTCLNSLTNFIDASTGGITSWAWDFGDNSTSSEQNPTHVFSALGTYDVTLTVNDGNGAKFYTQTITIGESDLNANTVVNNDGILASTASADSYQWYRDNLPIAGATQRTLDTQEESGTYFVVTFSQECNLKSNEIDLVISSIEDEIIEQFDRATSISPNPTDDLITISMINDFYGDIQTTLIDLTGKQYWKSTDRKEDRSFEKQVRVETLPAGLYIVNLLIGEGIVINKKVLIK